MGSGIYLIHSVVLPGVYFSSSLYMSPALIWINTVRIMRTCIMCTVHACMYVCGYTHYIITVDFEHCVLCTLIPESEQVVLDSWNPCSVTLLI